MNNIFASPIEIPLGYVNPSDIGMTDILDEQGNMHKAQHMFVKRVATRDEYLRQFDDTDRYASAFYYCVNVARFFYEILMD